MRRMCWVADWERFSHALDEQVYAMFGTVLRMFGLVMVPRKGLWNENEMRKETILHVHIYGRSFS